MPVINEYLTHVVRARVAVLLALPRAFSARGRLLSLRRYLIAI